MMCNTRKVAICRDAPLFVASLAILTLISQPAMAMCSGTETLPAGWGCVDVNLASGQNGSVSYSNGTFTISGGGKPVSSFAHSTLDLPGHRDDAFTFVYREVTGDFEMTARVFDRTGFSTSLYGLMVRERAGEIVDDARYVYSFLDINTSPRCFNRWRAWQGEPTRSTAGFLPLPGSSEVDLRFLRYGDQIAVYCRADGASEWIWNDGVTLQGLGDTETIDVGLAVTSRSTTQLGTAKFDEVVVNAQTTPHETSWIGNSLPGGGTHIPLAVFAIYVDPNGNIFTNTAWDEDAGESLVIKTDGTVERMLDHLQVLNRLGGYAITSNGTYIYVGSIQQGVPQPSGCCGKLSSQCSPPDDPNNPVTLVGGGTCQEAQTNDPCCCDDPRFTQCDEIWYGVRRYNLDGTLAPFTGGTNLNDSLRVVSTGDSVRGMAFYGSTLYVGDPAAGCVRAFDEDLQPLSSSPLDPNCVDPDFPMERIGAIATDHGSPSALWLVQNMDPADPNGSPGKALRYDPSTESILAEAAVDDPTGLAVASDGKAWVADDGPDQQIKIFDPNGTRTGTFGEAGGVYGTSGAARGAVGNNGKRFNGPVGVGFDDDGNIYVASNGPDLRGGGLRAGSGDKGTGTDIKKFTSAGELVWELFGLEEVDGASPDPATDGNNVYTKQERFTMDYDNPSGEQWTYSALTLDRFEYPDDGRLHRDRVKFHGVTVRHFGGKKILYVHDGPGQYLAIYRFEPGSEIAIPSGLLMKAGFSPVFYDPNSWPFAFPCTKDGGVPASPPSPCKDRYIWRDKSGDGRMDGPEDPNMPLSDPNSEYELDGPANGDIYAYTIDNAGDIWTVARHPAPGSTYVPIRRYRFKGFDSVGNPQYFGTNSSPCPDGSCVFDYETTQEFPYSGACRDPNIPNGTCAGPSRAVYSPATDTLYVAGYTPSYPQEKGDEAHALGRVIVRYNDWGGNRTVAWSIEDLPYGAYEGRPYGGGAKSMRLDGNRLVVGIDGTAKLRVHETACGSLVQEFAPGPEVAGKSGGVISHSMMDAHRRNDGRLVLFAGELSDAKVLAYQDEAPSCASCDTDHCNDTGSTCSWSSEQSQTICPISYCKEGVGGMLRRCTHNGTFGPGVCPHEACCDFTCVIDETCTEPDEPPENVCP